MNEEKTTLLKQQMSYEEEMQRKRNAQCQLNEEQGLKFLCNEKPINTNNEQLQQQKLLNQACYSEYLKQTYQTNTHPSLHWLGMSRSQDDEATIKSNSRSYRSTHTSPFRVKFRKSHTCGSLFANCNCNSVMTPIEQTRGEPTVPRSIPQPMARHRLTSPPPCMFSISPPSGDVSMSASSLLSTKTTSGIYSLSSAPPSAQLSRDSEDSRSASFDVYATSPTNTTAQITSTSGAHTQSSAQTQTLTRQSCCEISTQSAKQVSTRQRTSGVTVTITGTDAESETKLTAAEISDAKCTRQIKRLFQSYSHPDTDFVFTDENKHPLRALQNDTVIKSKSGRVEFKQHKRSSSPNIGQVLDVAVHPDIVIKVTPKHQTGTANLQTPASATQRRRLLQRTHEIDSNSSTSGSEHSFEVPQSSSESAETLTPPLRTTEHNFDAAQKYFVESGILGPNPASNLIRKTSKILQDSHVIEQIRRTSIILRANNISKKTSIANSPTSSSSARVLDADTPDKKMESLEQTVFYAAPTTTQGNTSKFTNICEYSPTMPTNNNCLIDDDREALIKNLQGEILSLKDVSKCRDNEITKLRREIHKLKSVLQQTTEHLPIRLKDETLRTPTKNDTNQATNQETTFTQTSPVACALDSKLIDAEKANTKESNVLSEQSAAPEATAVNGDKHSKLLQTVLKKQGVSGESCETAKKLSNTVPIPKYEKDYSAKQLIKDAIMDNDFLKNIDASQARELVESFYPLSINKGEFVIREGDVGAHLYVSAQGEFEVVKGDKVLGTMGPGKAFGELAILYNCTRTASIRVLTDARVWVLDRRVFQQIMMRTGMQRRENSVNFLKSVPLLKNLSEELLAKIADVLEVEFYPAGTYIIRQGANGDTFFLISQGDVKVTQKLPLTNEEKEIRTLTRGDYFGEQALLNEDKRTANIIAMAPGVECLTLDRESFTHLIGDLCELKQKSYGDEPRVLAMKASNKITEVFGANAQQEFPELKLTDLEVVATLGLGGFGRVELVKAYRDNRVDIFALKCLKKRHIVDTKQEEHVFSERTIMLSCNSPFICRLYRTFRDSKYVYMLLEACMGGEIWTMLRDRGCFDDNATQFIIGCVLQAFEYLHSRGIIYRDLKPENLMLDERGYVKLVDFGFAKYIGNSSKTWTFCGTPEYVAPEIILNKGHDRAVDYWALGILIHELLNGTPPFSANDPMKTYNNILKGIDMIAFPKHMSRSAVMLIKKLCRDVPAERLGYQKGGIQDIKKHKWFLGFDWDGLESQLLIPPFVRPIAHPTDTTYFDKFPCDPTEAPDEESGWDADF